MISMITKLFQKKSIPQEPDVSAPEREDAPRIFARLFASDDGAKALSYLRVSVNARVAGPEAPEPLLRFQDGQRALLQTIQGLIAQGRQ